jgi:hypothetical protein
LEGGEIGQRGQVAAELPAPREVERLERCEAAQFRRKSIQFNESSLLRSNSTAPVFSASWMHRMAYLIVFFLRESLKLGLESGGVRKVYQKISSPYDIEILVALPDGEGSGPWEEFMAEDFWDEDVLGHVFGFKAVAADGGVSASQVAWVPGKGEGAEGGRNVLGELRAGGGVDGIGGRKAF